MLNDPTLVLNRSWVAITTTTVWSALGLVCRGAAKVIEPETCITHDLRSWSDLRPKDGEPSIRTVRSSIRVPEIIVLTEHDSPPRRSVPFSRRNLYRRDGYRCQYCGKGQSAAELSIDHVVPRSRGGRTTWDNCVLSCIPCNVKKGSRLLNEAGMSLVAPPGKPVWSPCLLVNKANRRPSWMQFVSDAYWGVELEHDD
jgi:5-methylcytosine-specific restriction endonuclease McrA